MKEKKILELLAKYEYEFASDKILFDEVKDKYLNDPRPLNIITEEINYQAAKIRTFKDLVKQKIDSKILKSSIILIGPVAAGKTTIAKRLGNELGMPRISLDDKKALKDLYDFENALAEKKDFDFYLVAKVLTNLKEPTIIDFGGNHSIYTDPLIFAHLKTILSKFYNVIYLLPSKDFNESLKVLDERLIKRNPDNAKAVSKVNRKFIMSACNEELATNTIYTNHKNINEVVEEVLQASIKNISDFKKGN